MANRFAFGVDLSFLPALQFTEYLADESGYYDWHIDTFLYADPVPKATHRKLSLIMQLSNPHDYDGGDIELKAYPPPDKLEIRRRGMMLIFPSLLYHRVMPVTRGKRYSIVAWYEGPQWR